MSVTTTIDHISGGRAVLGRGGGGHAREDQACGVDFDRSPGQRLDFSDEASLGVTSVACSLTPPYDRETLRRLIEDVVPRAAGAR